MGAFKKRFNLRVIHMYPGFPILLEKTTVISFWYVFDPDGKPEEKWQACSSDLHLCNIVTIASYGFLTQYCTDSNDVSTY